MKENYKIFESTNLGNIEKEVKEFIQKLGNDFIDEKLTSTNPKYQIKVTYREE